MLRMNPDRLSSSEKGIALAASLLALSMLTLIGLAMTFVSSTEVLVNQNNRMFAAVIAVPPTHSE